MLPFLLLFVMMSLRGCVVPSPHPHPAWRDACDHHTCNVILSWCCTEIDPMTARYLLIGPRAEDCGAGDGLALRCEDLRGAAGFQGRDPHERSLLEAARCCQVRLRKGCGASVCVSLVRGSGYSRTCPCPRGPHDEVTMTAPTLVCPSPREVRGWVSICFSVLMSTAVKRLVSAHPFSTPSHPLYPCEHFTP